MTNGQQARDGPAGQPAGPFPRTILKHTPGRHMHDVFAEQFC
jgi:hypothetical protein